ncbi:MAG TPA: response regulator [Thermodesulfobacteriota bacterium]|nr:response regulator [Thermodesulfobacteriota bacterium]
MQEVANRQLKESRKKIFSRFERNRDILIVDDEESIGVGMSETLKDAGYNVRYVTSGAEAIEAVRKKPYGLVFMDIVMPGVNGLDAFRKIKQFRGGDTKVVLFTGFFRDAENIIFEGVKEGMIDEFLRKPFFAEEIVNTARKYV